MPKRSANRESKPQQQLDLLVLLNGPEIGSDVLQAIDLQGEAGLKELLHIASGEVAKANAEQRGKAIFALSVFAWEPAAETVAKLALNDEPTVRQHAILALPRFDKKFANAKLLGLLSRAKLPDIELAQVLDGLRLTGDASTSDEIEKWIVKTPSPTLRVIAEDTIVHLRSPSLDQTQT